MPSVGCNIPSISLCNLVSSPKKQSNGHALHPVIPMEQVIPEKRAHYQLPRPAAGPYFTNALLLGQITRHYIMWAGGGGLTNTMAFKEPPHSHKLMFKEEIESTQKSSSNYYIHFSLYNWVLDKHIYSYTHLKDFTRQSYYYIVIIDSMMSVAAGLQHSPWPCIARDAFRWGTHQHLERGLPFFAWSLHSLPCLLLILVAILGSVEPLLLYCSHIRISYIY